MVDDFFIASWKFNQDFVKEEMIRLFKEFPNSDLKKKRFKALLAKNK